MYPSPAYVRIADQIKAEWFAEDGTQGGRRIPSQEELALRFGVSRSTIVRALSKLVAEGYLRSQQGSGVYVADAAPPRRASAGSARSIGLIVPSLHAPVIVQACRGVERRARQLGYRVLLAASEAGLEHERELVEQCHEAGAVGVVLYPVTRLRSELAGDYLANGSMDIPIVTMDIGCEEWRCSRVQFDNEKLGGDLTQQLVRHGHRRIAFMHTSPEYLHSSVHERCTGWAAAMDEAGLTIPEAYRGWPLPDYDQGYRGRLNDDDYAAIADSLLRLDPRPDAVIAWTDVDAAYLIQALINRGVRVPEEIRVTGFDAEPLINTLYLPLFPTSKPDFRRLGEIAVDVLQRTITTPGSTRIYYYPVPVLWREAREAREARQDMAVRRSAAEPAEHADSKGV